MEAAKKPAECSCGAISDVVCDGCGKTICSMCSTRQICSFDPRHILVKHYCQACAHDVRKNVWGELYWKGLISLLT
ncbi:MAG TPA: hypothetical protein PKM41_11765 [Deltaproteobacteria bacterium]|nr:hypothetical protein [Deltaproteobacteria bacterium]HOI07843.1 hypothetical protein [Deltaproteobacteria bacterium]